MSITGERTRVRTPEPAHVVAAGHCWRAQYQYGHRHATALKQHTRACFRSRLPIKLVSRQPNGVIAVLASKLCWCVLCEDVAVVHAAGLPNIQSRWPIWSNAVVTEFVRAQAPSRHNVSHINRDRFIVAECPQQSLRVGPSNSTSPVSGHELHRVNHETIHSIHSHRHVVLTGVHARFASVGAKTRSGIAGSLRCSRWTHPRSCSYQTCRSAH